MPRDKVVVATRSIERLFRQTCRGRRTGRPCSRSTGYNTTTEFFYQFAASLSSAPSSCLMRPSGQRCQRQGDQKETSRAWGTGDLMTTRGPAAGHASTSLVSRMLGWRRTLLRKESNRAMAWDRVWLWGSIWSRDKAQLAHLLALAVPACVAICCTHSAFCWPCVCF